MLLTFIAAAHPSLTHLLFALCFIERDESVFPFYCPAWPTLLPQWYIHQTAPAAQLMNRSMWPDAGTVTDFKFLFVGIQMRVPNWVSHSGGAVRGSFQLLVGRQAVLWRKATYVTDCCQERLIHLSCFTFRPVIIKKTDLEDKASWKLTSKTFSGWNRRNSKQLIDPSWLLIDSLTCSLILQRAESLEILFLIGSSIWLQIGLICDRQTVNMSNYPAINSHHPLPTLLFHHFHWIQICESSRCDAGV